MEKRTKMKLQNTVEQTGAAIGMTALALVASALGPIVNTAWQVQKLKEKSKQKPDGITMDDLKEAITSYATNFLPFQKRLAKGVINYTKDVIAEGKERLNTYAKQMQDAAEKVRQKQEEDAATTPKALQESGVASILSLIDTANSLDFIDKPYTYDLCREFGIPMDYLPKNIAKIGTVYLPISHPTVCAAYIRMSNGAIKSMPYPELQQRIIVEHLIARRDELKRMSEAQNRDDFTATILTQERAMKR